MEIHVQCLLSTSRTNQQTLDCHKHFLTVPKSNLFIHSYLLSYIYGKYMYTQGYFHTFQPHMYNCTCTFVVFQSIPVKLFLMKQPWYNLLLFQHCHTTVCSGCQKLIACMIAWDFMFPFWANPLPHTSHLNGFSPVCIRMCCFSLAGVGSILPQNSHEYFHILADFSPKLAPLFSSAMR